MLTINEPLLQFFYYEHLSPDLQMIARPFSELAHAMILGDNNTQSGSITIGSGLNRNPERTVALRKLLEAKDAAIRSELYQE